MVLAIETFAFLRDVPLLEFLTGTEWTPLFADKHFGMLPLVAGTMLISAIAIAVALPLGLLARDLSERVRARWRSGASSSPARDPRRRTRRSSTATSRWCSSRRCCRQLVPGLAGFNALSPGIVMGIMILPMVASLSEDAHARGADAACAKARTRSAPPACRPPCRWSCRRRSRGITAAVILAASRAIGETMIVAIAAGQQPRFTANPPCRSRR